MTQRLTLDEALARAGREIERADYDRADATLRAILAAAPGLPQALALMGRISLIEGRNDMAAGLRRLAGLGLAPAHILDIGAYEGWWAGLARSIFPQAHILMIEAQESKGAILEAEAARLGNAHLRVALLGPESGRPVRLHIPDTPYGSTGTSLYPERSDFARRTEERVQTRLDDLVKGEPPYDLIKLDVQGAERDVLEGGPNTLATAKAVIVEVSMLAYNQGAPLMAEIVRYLDERGFQMLDFVDPRRGKGGILYQADAIFLSRASALVPDRVW
ncbi:MAG: FkbM family methyltransferase [Rhodospirillales bacterium]|nr:FkbM family methyltransferase [Rhodospirillales bacterium]